MKKQYVRPSFEPVALEAQSLLAASSIKIDGGSHAGSGQFTQRNEGWNSADWSSPKDEE